MEIHKNPSFKTFGKELSFHAILAILSFLSYTCYVERISFGPFRPYFFQLFYSSSAIALLLLLAGRISNLIRPFVPDWGKSFVRESWIPIALITFTLFQFKGMFEGECPSTCDHTTQLLRCQLTEQALWNHGTLLPWTSAFGAGVPLNDLYPVGGTLLYCLIRLLSGFLLGPEAA